MLKEERLGFKTIRVLGFVLITLPMALVGANANDAQSIVNPIRLQNYTPSDHAYVAGQDNRRISASSSGSLNATSPGSDVRLISKNQLPNPVRVAAQPNAPASAETLIPALDTYKDSRPHSQASSELRPSWQSAKIRQAGFEESAGSESAAVSFIDAERMSDAPPQQNAQELIKKIGINLVFVLVIAVGCLLMIKQLKKPQATRSRSRSSDEFSDELQIAQTLPLNGGATLYVVDGIGSKFLVAVDGNGIKSVESIRPNFQAAMEELNAPEEEVDVDRLRVYRDLARESRGREDDTPRQSRRQRNRAEAKKDPDLSAAELDDKLMEMLLGSRKAS